MSGAHNGRVTRANPLGVPPARVVRAAKVDVPRARFLLALPTELHLTIISHLPHLDTQMLRLTNHHFHGLIPLHTPTTPDLTPDDLLRVEKLPWIKSQGTLYCASCNKLRHRDKFADDMKVFTPRWLTSRKVKGRKDQPWMKNKRKHFGNKWRFCVECGMKKPRSAGEDFRYHSGHVWKYNGVAYVRCYSCKEVKEAITEPEWSGFLHECADCRPESHRRTALATERRRQWDEMREERRERHKLYRVEDEARVARGEEPIERPSELAVHKIGYESFLAWKARVDARDNVPYPFVKPPNYDELVRGRP